MTIWTPVVDPRARRRRSWVFDAFVTLIAGLWTVFAAIDSSQASPVVAAVVLVGITLPLFVRRLWPLPVFVTQIVIAASLGWWAGQAVWSIALLVGLYTVASLRPRREALWSAAALEVGIVAAAIRLPDAGSWWGNVIALTGVMVAALAVGLYVGTRRTLLAQLRERAVRLERERDQQGELAAAAERARIAREMHDIVAHHLTVMVALSDGAVAAAARSPERSLEAMRTVSATGRQALADTRLLLGVLREGSTAAGETADFRPLPDLSDLDDLLGRVRAAGLPVRYEVQGTPGDIPPAVQLTMFRLVQEALTNTMKHAGSGASASVSLHYAPELVTVDVVDDGGRGQPAPTGGGTGRGLAGMRERVSAYGGSVSVGPVDGAGWRVSATVRRGEPVTS